MNYRYREILERIRGKVEEEYGTREERGHKALYIELGIEKSQWKRKWDGSPEFTWDEISRISEHFKAPPGWPFVCWEAASANDRALQLLERFAPPGAPPGDVATPAGAAPSGQPERPARGGRKR